MKLSLRTLVIFLLLLAPSMASAQLLGQNIKGDVGLKAGSQSGPGAALVLPFYFYNASELKNASGTTVATGSVNGMVFGAGISMVTNTKIFGANYGFMVAVPGSRNQLQGGSLVSDTGVGITDSFVQPIALGWHTLQADVTASYGLFVPTGRYADGASNNTGLGMWGQELGLGTTVYLNPERTVHAATLATYDIFSKKKDSQLQVGNILNLEGGVGVDTRQGRLTLGLTYYASWKVTDDKLSSVLGAMVLGKNRVFALGPEMSMTLASRSTIYGSVTARYQWETGAQVSTQGQAFNIVAAFLLKPIKLPPTK